MSKPSRSYLDRREQLQEYFDKTAVKAWERLTTDAPVSGIRQTVREGRDSMRSLLLGWLPEDLTGKRLLDAGLRYWGIVGRSCKTRGRCSRYRYQPDSYPTCR